MRPRVIPVLLLQGMDLVKTVGFKKPKYIGDPINAIRLFNDLEVDEILVFDINASKRGAEPQWDLLYEFATEAFMPLCYGGGVRSVDQMAKLFSMGIEKVAVNAGLRTNKNWIREAVAKFGSQSVVAAIDVKKRALRRTFGVYHHESQKEGSESLADVVAQVQEWGVGEIILNSVNNDGGMKGYDLAVIESIKDQVKVPLIACGGCGSLEDMRSALKAGADAVAAGSFFVYHGEQRGILINYLTNEQLNNLQ